MTIKLVNRMKQPNGEHLCMFCDRANHDGHLAWNWWAPSTYGLWQVVREHPWRVVLPSLLATMILLQGALRDYQYVPTTRPFCWSYVYSRVGIHWPLLRVTLCVHMSTALFSTSTYNFGVFILISLLNFMF